MAKDFCGKNNIKLNDFSYEASKLDSFMDSMEENYLNIEQENIFGAAKYKLSANKGIYLYSGETKGDYPSGYGILLEKSNYANGITYIDGNFYNILYAGSFKKGKFNGYGIEFHKPDHEELSFFRGEFSEGSKDYILQYTGWMNYAEYEGKFDDGKRNGKGNQFIINLKLQNSVLGTTLISKQPTYDEVIVGSFKNGNVNGKCQLYIGDNLSYDGEMKDNKKDGYGYEYAIGNYLEYKGEFKNDKRDGKGTLYDENWEVIYEGKWKNGDYK